MAKNKGGRQIKYVYEYVEEIKEKLEAYIEDTEIPIVAEFCYKNYIPRTKIYEFEQLKDSIKRLIDKKETNLERQGLNANNTMSIFSLKQLGWRDNDNSVNSLSESEMEKLRQIASQEMKENI